MTFHLSGYSWFYAPGYVVRHKRDAIAYLLYVFKTPATVTFGDRQVNVDMNDIMLVDTGEPHTVSAGDQEYWIDWVIFDMDQNDLHTIKLLGLPFNEVKHVESSLMLSNIIMNCSYVNTFDEGDHSRTLDQLVMSSLYCAASLVRSYELISDDMARYPEMTRLRMQIYAHPEEDWTVERMCRLTNRSHSSLQQLYRDIFSISCNDDVIESRVQRAKELLKTTDLTILDIAGLCGYKSTTHFSRQFKQRTGLTPSTYREKKAKKKS